MIDDGSAAAAQAQQPTAHLMWSAPNSVAWGARFLGGPDNATTVEPSVSNSTPASSQTSGGGGGGGGGGNESTTLFIGVIVSLIVAFYLLCTYQCLRIWLCRKCFGREVDAWGRTLPSSRTTSMHGGAVSGDGGGEGGNGPDATVLVHEGRVFNLSGDQRRQVLEVIFSEASKPATDMDVAKLKKKRRKRNGGMLGADGLDDGDDDDLEVGRGRGDSDDDDDYDEDDNYGGRRLGGVPLDVQIPGVATAKTDDTSTADDGTASPASSSSAAKVGVFRRLPAGQDPEGDGDDSITSHGEVADGDAGDNAACGGVDDEYDSAGTSSLSASDPDRAKRETPECAVAAATTNSRSSDSPSTPERYQDEASDDIVLLTPILLDTISAGDEQVDAEESATPRASGHKTDLVHNDNEVPPAAAVKDSVSRSAMATTTPIPRSSAVGDESAMLMTMVPIAPHPMLRQASKGKSFVIPEDEIVEEAKREIIAGGSADSDDNANRDLSLHIPIPLMKRESFASATSEYTYDDGSTITGDNLCPICLSGFKIGDLLVTSKYCSHVFHKDCILEWLGKNDNCPVCRVDMVTASEMNKAATTLVGKTRMVRAVASLQANSTHGRASSPQRTGNAVSPLQGTVRRRAHSATYS